MLNQDTAPELEALHPSVGALWQAFLATFDSPAERARKRFDCWCFGDNEHDANELAELTRRGIKRATSPSLWRLQHEGDPMPEPGNLHIVTDWQGLAHCVVRTTEVEVRPFDRITAAYAALEGEGDGSLAYWRRVHWDYYSRELAPTGHVPSWDMPIVCERFTRVFVAARPDR